MIPDQTDSRYLYPRRGDPVLKLRPGGRCTAHTYWPNTEWRCTVDGCPGRLPPADRPAVRVLTPYQAQMRADAMDLIGNGWEIFPLRGKVSWIRNPHPEDSPEHKTCKGECGLDGHGVLDATTDPAKIWSWWTDVTPGANIGARVPAGLIVVDTDPRKTGMPEWHALVEANGLPETLTVASGRGDGGLHRYFIHPGGKATSKGLPDGVDLKTHSGYCVVPPSIHPDSGKPYRWVREVPPAEMPAWLTELIRPVEPERQARKRSTTTFTPGTSIADQFSASSTWAQILEPHGWRCRSHDGDADGAVWLHPDATSSCSATVRNGCLFVYSTSTVLPITETGDPHGLTRFRAWALLDHGGDMSKAWEALGGVRGARAEDLIGGKR